MDNMDRLLLILDLDETLIFSSEAPLTREADFRVFQYYCYKRPNLNQFLDKISQWYEVAVWSSASDPYVEAVVHHIFPNNYDLKFVWGRSRATLPRNLDRDIYWDVSHQEYVKDLSKLKNRGWSKERILIVDDTPQKSRRNYGNAIYPSVFEGDPSDNELALLSLYLETIKDCKNVRVIEKRDWRSIATRIVGKEALDKID